MELLYTYIESYNNLIEKQEFSFSTRFKINYNLEKRILAINDSKNYLPNFYGQTITDITAIVGENGVGKTTVLDIIGNDYNTRIRSSSYIYNQKYEYKDKYFLLYYLEENIFYVEGIGVDLLKNTFDDFSLKYIKDNFKHGTDIYSMFLRKLEDGQTFTIELFEKEGEEELKEREAFEKEAYEELGTHVPYYELKDNSKFYRENLYIKRLKEKTKYIYINENKSSRITDEIVCYAIEETMFLNRNILKKTTDVDWYKTLINNFLENKFGSTFGFGEENVILTFSKFNYNSKFYSTKFIPEVIIHSETNSLGRSAMIMSEIREDFFRNFQNGILNNILYIIGKENEEISTDTRKVEKYIENLRLDSIWDFHNNIFLNFEKEYLKKNKIEGNINEYYILTKEVFLSLLSIDELKTTVDTFDLCISSKNKYILEFLKYIKELEEFVAKIDYGDGFVIPFTIVNKQLSEGQRKLIDLMSKIKRSISGEEQEYSLRKRDCNLILVIDEPDNSMHPEWARKIISNIINYIDKELLFDENDESDVRISEFVKIQIIISTHSPFILSDLKRDNIIHLKKENRKLIKVSELDFEDTFAQNIHTILSNTFFLSSTIGEFAYKKIQGIVKDLNSTEYDISLERKREMKFIIEYIGEPIIKKKLENMYYKKFGKEENDYKLEIERLKNEKENLEKILNNDGLNKIENIMNLLNSKIKELEKKLGDSI